MEEGVQLVTGIEVAPANNLYEFYIKLRKIYPRGTQSLGIFFPPSIKLSK